MDPGAAIAVRLLVMLVFGAIAAAVASNKGRNVVGWFFIGFFFTCIGLIILLCLSNLREEQERWNRSETEQRRLREQLKQERLKNEAFQGHVRQRLDVHDQALGVNTREIAGPEGNGEQAGLLEGPAPGGAPGALPASSPESGQWFVRYGERTSQALTLARLKKIYGMGKIDRDTLVRNGQEGDWIPLHQVPGLLEALL